MSRPTERKIFKYALRQMHFQYVNMPVGATILAVQNQHEELRLWALVDPNAETVGRCFEIYGTGSPIISDLGASRNYIGTVQLEHGALVLHVFEYTGI